MINILSRASALFFYPTATYYKLLFNEKIYPVL